MVTPGYKRLLDSGQAEALRQQVLKDQEAALNKAQERRTLPQADASRDHPTWPANHYPKPKGKRK